MDVIMRFRRYSVW